MTKCPVYVTASGKEIPVNNFIQPKAPAVIEVVMNLKGDNPFEACLGFVCREIHYQTDTFQYGVRERWAYPTETLQTRCGDCEDKSFLLASMLLALNVPGETVAVELGKHKGQGHAWVVIQDLWGKEYVLETTASTPPVAFVNILPRPGAAANAYFPSIRIHATKCDVIGKPELYGKHIIRLMKDGDN